MDDLDIQGHRGARGLAPENSLPGFRKALELGVTTLEMDVVISADLQVVVSHDPWFSSAFCSMPNGQPIPEGRESEYRLFEMEYVDIRSFDCGMKGNPLFPTQRAQSVRKPLLSEVIEMAENFVSRYVRPPVRYNIETKSSPEGDGVLHPDPELFDELVMDVVNGLGVSSRTTIQSFDLRTLRVARPLNADIDISMLVSRTNERSVADNVDDLGFVPEVYSPDYHLVDEELVEKAQEIGMRVIPWTVNTIDEMNRLVELGVNGFITDYPDLAMEFVGR